MLPLLLLLLLLLYSATSSATPLPPSLSYHVTVRSFMASACRQDQASSSSDTFLKYCPDDASIRAQVANGTLSGHPDFERHVAPRAFNAATGPTFPYNTTYGGDRLPLTYINTPLTLDRTHIYPAVASTLQQLPTGIFTMQYCDRSNSLHSLCDSDFVQGDQPRSVKDRDSFSTWYADSRKFNRRMGYELELDLADAQTAKYTFDAQFEQDSLYDPITQNRLSSSAFPMSRLEANGFFRSGPAGNCAEYDAAQCYRGKYWFSTEIHTFFQYRGGESFLFKGDDDVHIYINHRLAINLGGEHNAIARNISLDHYTAELALRQGEIYAFDLFHVERQTRGSNYAMDTTLTQMCNVANVGSDRVSELIDWKHSGFHAEDWFIQSGPGFGHVINDVAYLMTPGTPDVVSYLFHRETQNLGSGFALEFDFRLSGGSGAGHGFSLLLHNRGLQDLNGGATGPNLGIKHLANSVAVVFDACSDYPRCGRESRFQLRMHYHKNGTSNSVNNATRRVYDADVVQAWKTDQAWHHVKVIYYAKPDWLEVYVDNSLRLVERGFDLQSVLGGNRDAFVGFAASSSREGSSMGVEIAQVVMRTVSVDYSRTVRDETVPVTGGGVFVADGRTTARFELVSLDACNTRYTSGGLGSLAQGVLVPVKATTADPVRRLRRRLQEEYEVRDNDTSAEDEDDDMAPTAASSHAPSASPTAAYSEGIVAARVIDQNDGTYALVFATTLPGEYDMHMSFGPGCGRWNGTAFADNSVGACWRYSLVNATRALEFVTQAPTAMPTAEEDVFDWEIFKWVMVGLACFLCCCCFWIILCVHTYRKRWREDKKFVKPGEIALIERTIDYSKNPYGVEMTNMTAKVQKSKQEIEKLRARDPMQEDERTRQHKAEMADVNSKLKDEVQYRKRKIQSTRDMDLTSQSKMVAQADPTERRHSFKPQRARMPGSATTDLAMFSMRMADEYEAEESVFRQQQQQQYMNATSTSSPGAATTSSSSSSHNRNSLGSSPGAAYLAKRGGGNAPPPPPAYNPGAYADDDEEELTVWETEKLPVAPPPPPPPHVDSEDEEEEYRAPPPPPPPPPSRAYGGGRQDPSPRRLSITGADMSSFLGVESEDQLRQEYRPAAASNSKKREFRF